MKNKTTLFKTLTIALLTLVCTTASAQLPRGVYAVVPYGNNPFLFCTKGMPTDGWIPINPYTGTWKPIRHTPNLYWVATYTAICPKGNPAMFKR